MLNLDQFLHQSLIQINLALNYLISFHISNGSSQVVRHLCLHFAINTRQWRIPSTYVCLSFSYSICLKSPNATETKYDSVAFNLTPSTSQANPGTHKNIIMFPRIKETRPFNAH